VALDPYDPETPGVNLRISAMDEGAHTQLKGVWSKMYTALRNYHECKGSVEVPSWTSWNLSDWYQSKKVTDRLKFAAWIGDVLVGFLNVRAGYPCHSEPGKCLLYIEHIATAPGNILQDIWGRRFKSVGTALVAYSILQSIERGYEGRIGLHAADDAAADYYVRLSDKHRILLPPKTEIPGTPEDRQARLHPYFESDPVRARLFLEGYRDE
jgi:hypothetical protein